MASVRPVNADRPRPPAPAPEAQAAPPEHAPGAERLGARVVLGWAGVVLAVVPFLVLWLLVRDSSSTLVRMDVAIAETLNEAVRGHPVVVDVLRVVTDLAGTATSVVVFSLTAAFLALQRRWRLAIFTATTGIGLAFLIPVSKSLIGRARPIVDVPLVEAPANASFPSGHAMSAVVLWGTLLLLTLPAVRRRGRPKLFAAVVALVLVVGVTRLALGVHFLSDVLAGWTLGVAWLVAMVLVFHTWPGPHDTHRQWDPMHQRSTEVADLGHPSEAVSRVPLRHLAALAGTASLTVGVFVALGLLLTRAGAGTWVMRWDRAVLADVIELRGGPWNEVAVQVSALSATPTVIATGLAIGMLALAVTHSWRPALLVAVATIGQTLIYVAVSRVVGRPRPDLADLTAGLPVEASWPSGHVAAAVALWGSLAAVLLRYSSRWLGRVAVAVAVVVALGVAASRVFIAAHHPSDVLAGLAIGAIWLFACVRWVFPPDPPPRDVEVSGVRLSEGL